MDLRFPGRSEMLGTMAAATLIDVDSLMQRLRTDIFRSRLRIKEFFTDFDMLRSGRCTEAKFRTALDESGLTLNDPELTQLSNYFADPSDPLRVRYEDFLNALEVFTTPGMETNPASTVTDFTQTLKQTAPVLDPDEEAACDNLIEKLSHIVKVRHLMIRPVFDDYYKNVNSPILVDQVTFAQFRNGLSTLGIKIDIIETELLQKRYAGKTPGYVNYVAFACDVDESERTFSTREPRSYVEHNLFSGFRAAPYLGGGKVPFQPGRPPTDLNQARLPVVYPTNPQLSALLEKLQIKAVQYLLRVADFFVDYDKHNDTTITQSEFVKGLAIAYDKMGLGLSEAETKLLLDSYGKKMRHGATHVLWRKFVDDIEKVFVTKNMEKDPHSSLTFKNGGQEPITLSPPSKEAAVQKLVADLRKRVDVRRVLVKPLFSDFTATGNKIQDHITRQQMTQALARFDIVLSAEDAQLLFERYDTLGAGTVNFVALVRDIDRYESFSARRTKRHVFPQDPDYGSVPTMNSGFWKDRVVDGPIVNVQPGRPPTTNDHPNLVAFGPAAPSLPDLLATLQKSANAQRLRVDEAFKDFDRHRDGTITIPQFQSALAITFGRYQPLSQPAVELLVRSYAVDKSGQAHVRWKEFVNDVNRIFTRTGLEKAPLETAPPLPPQIPRDRAVLTAEEEAMVASLLARLRKTCTHRRLLVKPFFTDAEYNRRSMRVVDHITKTQFSQCVNRLGLELNNDELEVLQRKYDDKGDGMVNYINFCVAIDPEEKNSDREGEEKTYVRTTFKANGNFYAPKTGFIQPGRAPYTGDTPSLLPARPSEKQLAPLMRRLQEKAIQFALPVADSFIDYDRHKLGAISVNQFRRGLNKAFGDIYLRESITADEMALLEAVYAREMLDGEHFVDWKQFCKDIQSALTTTNLETQPLTTPASVIPSIGHGKVMLSPQEEARVQEILAAMRERFRIRCVYVKAPFHDFAKSTNSAVIVDRCTRQQFVQGLSRLGIEPTAEDLDLLFKKYDDAGEGAINYVSFSTDVDSTETFSDRLRLPFSPVPKTTLHGGFRQPKVHEELLRAMM